MAPRQTKPAKSSTPPAYDALVDEIASLVESARRAAARSVNVLMTTTYWLIGQRIVEREQDGALRAAYGAKVIARLASDLSARLGRGYSERNLEQMRAFYLGWSIPQTASAESIGAANARIPQTLSAESEQARAVAQFPLPWSHYVRLLAVKNRSARTFYETEALRGGWSHAQLDRQIQSQFYERTALSRDKAAMLRKGAKPESSDLRRAEAEIKDPYVLEFLALKDEYAESDLEDALVAKLEQFLLELGGDFTFVGRQRRLQLTGAASWQPPGSSGGGLRTRLHAHPRLTAPKITSPAGVQACGAVCGGDKGNRTSPTAPRDTQALAHLQ